MLESKNKKNETDPLKMDSYSNRSNQDPNASIQSNINMINNQSQLGLTNNNENSNGESFRPNNNSQQNIIIRLKTYSYPSGKWPLIVIGPNSKYFKLFIILLIF